MNNGFSFVLCIQRKHVIIWIAELQQIGVLKWQSILVVMFLILGIMSIGLLALCKRIEKLEEWRRLTSVDLMKVLDFLEKKDKKDRT
jgi:hypothetical protein